MLVDRGVLGLGGGWTWTLASDAAEVPMPPTIDALLMARIDSWREKTRRPSGRFGGRARVLSGRRRGDVERRGAAIPSALGTLVRRQFVEPTQSSFVDESTYRFGHILIRDAAYGASCSA